MPIAARRLRVVLNPHELQFAAIVGCARNGRGLSSGKRNFIGNKEFGIHTDVLGAQAECAHAKAFNVYWPASIDTYKKPDVAGVQVRHTPIIPGSLRIRPGDSSEERFYLVTGEGPAFFVCGWILGVDGKIPEYELKGREGAPDFWNVPQNRLHDPLEDVAFLRDYRYPEVTLVEDPFAAPAAA